MRILFCLCLLLTFLTAPAQDTLNNFDEHGERHGPWKKYFEEDPNQLRFEGEFVHGKETGLFRFYKLGLKKPAATKHFSPDSNIAEVKFLSQKGKVISEGKMQDTTRLGEWKYYHKNSDKLMMLEHYENGILNGEKITYYENGQPAEKAFYMNGELHGEVFMYSEKGVVLEHLTYENGELHGPAKFYNGKGELVTEGNYKRDKHHGIWKYYENDELKEEKDFSPK